MTWSCALRILLLLALGAPLAGCSTLATNPHSPQFTRQSEDAIRVIGERAVVDDGIVGLSIGIAINGEIVFSDGFGHADSERSTPANSLTIYDIASVGKHFTAAAVLQLAERGALSLDDRVRSFVPELPAHFPDTTIEQLLRHTSGFVSGDVLGPLEPHDMLVCEYVELPRGSQRINRTDEGIAPVPYIDMTAWSGQGSICSSAVDLLRWSNALNSERIITRRSLTALRSPSLVRGTHANAEIPYGMAQRLGAIGGFRKVGHTGTFDGGSAALAYYPDASLEIAVISNTYGGGTPHAHTIETAIAKLLLGVTDPHVASLRVPVSAEQRRAIEGAYTDGRIFEASIDDDELVVTRDDKELERLIHIGNMRFRKPDMPDVFEWFILDGENAGWWVYSMSGNYLEVVRRVEP